LNTFCLPPLNPISHSTSVDAKLRCTEAFWQTLEIAAGVKSGFQSVVQVLTRAVNLAFLYCDFVLKRTQKRFYNITEDTVHHFCLVEFWVFIYGPLEALYVII